MKRVSKNTSSVDLHGKRCFIGADVHKRSYHVSILAEDGSRKEFVTAADPDLLLNTLLVKMNVEVIALAYETGPTGYALAWACQEAGIAVVVAPSSRIPRPIAPSGKTDKLDCMKLANLLAKGMLKSIAIPDRDDFAFRELYRRSRQLTQSRAKLKQEIKAFLLKNAIPEPIGLKSWTQASLEELTQMPLPTLLRATLDSFLEELRSLNRHIATVKNALAKGAKETGKAASVAKLQTIPGVGPVIAYTFTAEIFRPERFERSAQIGAYAGLAPIVKQSGNSKSTARLRSVGQKHLRCALVEGAWIWMQKD
ncbi:MAG: IS110 family transposase, partial [Clostridium sp.]|nr:IS110 family transposase [Clostridium sp.]